MSKYSLSIEIIRNIIELHLNSISGRQIAKNLNLTRDEVQKYILLFKEQCFTNVDELIDFVNDFNKDKLNVVPLPEQEQAYAYLLGMYLGDGYIVKVSKTYALRIFLDAKYPGIIERVAEKMKTCYPHNSVTLVHKSYKGNPSCVEVKIYNNKIPQHFPQNGNGRKHERKIELTSWQKIIVEQYPQDFLRGLFESDGSRYLRQVKNAKKEIVYSYANYNFTNVSKDIIDILIETLNVLGIRFGLQHKLKNKLDKNKQYVLEVSAKKDVEFLDTFIGPKK